MRSDYRQPEPDDAPEALLFVGRPALVPGVGTLLLCIATAGLALIWLWLRRMSVHYKITTERIVVERGLLSKRMEQIDVYRINDYTVERPIGQRIMGTGNLVVNAMDRTTPQIRIAGLKTDVVQLYEQVRAATEAEKRRRGVRMIDYE